MCDFLYLTDVNEWMSYKCSDKYTYTQNIHNSSIRLHPSEEENCTRTRSENCKCKQAKCSKSFVKIENVKNVMVLILNKNRISS
jgi:hypothetical protein